MKKYLLMLIMMLSLSVYSFAEDNSASEVTNIEKYDFRVNTKKLAHTLDLTSDQTESVDYVFNEFSRDMFFAAHETNKESQYKIMSNAIAKNIKYMNYVLTDAQKHKYIRLLNVTLYNRGFDMSKLTNSNE